MRSAPTAATPRHCRSAKLRRQLAGGSVVEFEAGAGTARCFRSRPASPAGRAPTGFQYGAILRDISVRKREAEQIRYLAEHDTLTGLANRNTLHARLAAMISAAEAERGEVALLVRRSRRLPADQRHAGPRLWRPRAVRGRRAIEAAMLARPPSSRGLRGDEFAIAFCCADMTESVAALAERIAPRLRRAGAGRRTASTASRSASAPRCSPPAAAPPTNCSATATSPSTAPRRSSAAAM